VVVEPEHIKRLKGIVSILRKVIEENDDGTPYAKMGMFMTTLTDELAEDMKDMDELKVRLFMFQIGESIAWIGHGDNERLPEFVRPFAEMIQPMVVRDDADNEAGSHIGIGTESR
jgi:hypothetical protein